MILGRLFRKAELNAILGCSNDFPSLLPGCTTTTFRICCLDCKITDIYNPVPEMNIRAAMGIARGELTAG
jgi:hypothetical protein